MRTGYALAALAVFLIEVAIALWVRDGIVRNYLGDVLAVALVYLALRAVTPFGRVGAAVAALAVAVIIELGQLIHVLDMVGLGGDRLTRVVLGGVFDLRDIACYGVGALIVLALDRALVRGS